MNQRSDVTAHLRELFPQASDDLLALFRGAEENAAVLPCDLHTLRDWLQIADYQDESLHALLLLLILAEQEGSLCIELSKASCLRRLGDLVPPAQAAQWAERLTDDLATHDFSRLIGTDPADNRPVIQHAANGRRYLYFQKFLRHELEFADAFRAKLSSAACERSSNVDALLRIVLDQQPLRQESKPLVLDPDQRRALALALTRALTIVSGGPGTGKTSIVLNLLRCLVRSGVAAGRIALAAPTGRAAQRLTDAIGLGLASLGHHAETPDAALAELRAVTLHQLLDYVPSRDQFRRHAENPLPAEVVIVDEASMVGMVVMARLFQALEPQARLVLLGDKDQLPSVDAGAVLANLMEQPPDEASGVGSIREATVILRTNHRSEPHIRATAAAINLQDSAVLDSLPLLRAPGADEPWTDLAQQTGVRLLEQTSQTPAEIRRILTGWAEHAYVASGFERALAECLHLGDEDDNPRRLARLGELFQLLDRTRLLTLVREGPWGCVDCNRFIAEQLQSRRDRSGRSSRGLLFPGVPVLITRNDHERQLYNGDVGITLRGAGGGLHVVFPRQGAFPSFPAESLPAHELGFALTVHKSQGSEYGQVLLVLPPTGGRRLLTKELVYTGITRARESAIVCATREVLRLAVGRKCVRESAFGSSLDKHWIAPASFAHSHTGQGAK
jgi:exodeoxyribonuclease V alpha subunit